MQIGSALGSTIGQLVRVPPARLRLLVACGAADGISATFNAPIAGVMFALELILRSLEAELFAVVVLASVAVDVVGRAAFGDRPLLPLAGFHLASLREYRQDGRHEPDDRDRRLGGIFAPSLFLGAMLGGAYGQTMNDLLPHQTAPSGAYALVGMAAVFAAAARAPITAVIIVFELTGDYRIILPLMCATVVATTLSSVLSRETIYSLKLTRRGIDILRKRPPTLLQRLTVEDAARPLPAALAGGLAPPLVAGRFAQGDEESLPVVGVDGRLEGIVGLDDVTDALASSMPGATASDLVRRHGSLRPGMSLEEALERLAASGGALPVEEPEPVGPIRWLRERDALQAYSSAARARSTQPSATRSDM